MSEASERRAVFDALSAALRDGEARAALPNYNDSLCVSTARLAAGTPWENFAANLRAVNGVPMRSVEDLAAFLREHGFTRGFCDPTLMGEIGLALQEQGIEVHDAFDRDRIDDYQFGITRADGAIAESGSVVLTDPGTADRLAALTPWVHVAVFRETEILRTIPEAIAQLGQCSHVVWVTGPSKTADIEGILIKGVHGPGIQIALCLP